MTITAEPSKVKQLPRSDHEHMELKDWLAA